jgi:hypothetical protein
VTPEVSGRPVALANPTKDGMPRLGVTRVGLILNTLLPVPEEVVVPVPPCAIDRAADNPDKEVMSEFAPEAAAPIVAGVKTTTPASPLTEDTVLALLTERRHKVPSK